MVMPFAENQKWNAQAHFRRNSRDIHGLLAKGCRNIAKPRAHLRTNAPEALAE
jgi:hypothetical protein